MPLLRDVQSLFRRKRPATRIDLAGTQAERLSAVVRAAEIPIHTPERAIEPAVPEPRTGDNGRRKEDELMGLMRKIGDRLDGQRHTSGRLVELLEHLPPALESVPEIHRQNANLLESLHEHFSQTGRREEALNRALAVMTESADRHTQVLTLIQQRLDTTADTTGQLTDMLDRLRGTLDELARTHSRSSQMLTDMTESTQRRESDMIAMLGRTQRWMIAALLICGLASITGAIIASAALMS